MSDDLVSGLLSDIEQREKKAQAALNLDPESQGRWEQSEAGNVYYRDSNAQVATGQWGDLEDEAGAHIAANDPRSVLRLCRAHRKIVEDYRRTKMLLAEANQRVLQQVVDGTVSTRQEQRDFDSLHVEEAVLREVVEGLAEGYGLKTEEDSDG